jgi:hypothetical protein
MRAEGSLPSQVFLNRSNLEYPVEISGVEPESYLVPRAAFQAVDTIYPLEVGPLWEPSNPSVTDRDRLV